MRTLKLNIPCSLDGFIARCNGAVEWLFTDGDYSLTKFICSVDAVPMGRKTYERVIGPSVPSDKEPYPGIKTYVMKSTPGKDNWPAAPANSYERALDGVVR